MATCRSRFVAATTRTSALSIRVPPRRWNSRSWRTRRNFACTAGLISPTSSRNSVPPAACSSRPARAATAPVKAPFSYPNSSDSSSASGRAAQLRATNGPSARRDPRWIRCATTSLPVPDSPLRSTVVSAGATFAACPRTSRQDCDVPTTPPDCSAPWSCAMPFAIAPSRWSASTGLVRKSSAPDLIARTDGVQERVLAEGFDEVCCRSAAQGLRARPGVVMRRHEDDRHVRMAGDQAALQLEAAHPGHAHIENRAVGPGEIIGLQEGGARRESPRGESDRPEEAAQGLADGIIVIDDGDQRTVGHDAKFHREGARGIRPWYSSLPSRLGVPDAQPLGHSHQVRQRGGPHLLHHPAPMDLDGDFPRSQLGSDLLVQQSGHHPLQHLALTRREGGVPLAYLRQLS